MKDGLFKPANCTLWWMQYRHNGETIRKSTRCRNWEDAKTVRAEAIAAETRMATKSDKSNGDGALKKQRAELRAQRKTLRKAKADPVRRTECQVELARVNLALAEAKLARLQQKKSKKKAA